MFGSWVSGGEPTSCCTTAAQAPISDVAAALWLQSNLNLLELQSILKVILCVTCCKVSS